MRNIFLALVATIGASAALVNQRVVAEEKHDLSQANVGVWFEIPVSDMDRAIRFYNAIFQINLAVDHSKSVPMAFFPTTPNYGTAGALIKMKGMQPGSNGPVVYLNGGADLDIILNRVEGAGGKVLVRKSPIPNVGFFAIFLDSEGNRLGLFSE